MFDFEKLLVYQKAKSFCKEVSTILSEKYADKVTSDQLRRASFSIMLNIAESSSRYSSRDRKKFLVIARGSTFECVAIIGYIYEMDQIGKVLSDRLLLNLEEISKMLFAMITKLETKAEAGNK